MSDEEEVQKALQVLQQYAIRRGDSFDIGSEEGSVRSGVVDNPQIIEILNNPRALADSLNLTEQQAMNIASLITGGVAGAGRKYLSQYLGAELAGALSGFLGGHISKKIMGK